MEKVRWMVSRGTIKNKVFRDVKSGKTKITDAESSAKYADNTISGIKSLYLHECDALEEPDDIEDAPKIAGTLEVHKIVREFNDDNVCNVKFFKLATDEKPFYQQWCRHRDDPEVRDHSVLSLMHDPDNTCASCRKPYLAKEDWLECKVCEQWFHERCFMT